MLAVFGLGTMVQKERLLVLAHSLDVVLSLDEEFDDCSILNFVDDLTDDLSEASASVHDFLLDQVDFEEVLLRTVPEDLQERTLLGLSSQHVDLSYGLGKDCLFDLDNV